MAIFAPFAHPLYVMLKPVGAVCNLACSYCYYLEKSKLYKDEPKHVMNDKLLEKFIEEYINSQTMPQILFTWHGGETLMRPLAFYKRAMELQQKYAHGRTISNCIQTNGTLLTDEWCEFLKKNDWLVGVSIDGPQEFHDRYRRNKQGQPSFVKVMKGIHLLNKYGVDWNAMAVVNNLNADYPLEFYNFFKEIGCRYIQFTPIVERIFRHNDGRLLATIGEDTPELMEFSVTPEQWGNFLCTIFEEWVHNDVGEYYIQLFDATLANWVGENPGICTMGKTCGHAGVMEFNGDVYSCDHFVFPQYKLGNIYSKTLIEMFYGEKQLEFGQNKYRSLPRQCKNCKFLFACNGECPKNRFCKTELGESGGTITDHILTINADSITLVDSLLIPTGEIVSVDGTPFDFRNPVVIGSRINMEDEQLRNGLGYDHNWVLKRTEAKVRLIASLYEPQSGRLMEVYTDQPGLQFYSGNFFNGEVKGKYGETIKYREALALETQKFPDSPNHVNFPSTYLSPEEKYTHTCIYKFSVKK